MAARNAVQRPTGGQLRQAPDRTWRDFTGRWWLPHTSGPAGTLPVRPGWPYWRHGAYWARRGVR